MSNWSIVPRDVKWYSTVNNVLVKNGVDTIEMPGGSTLTSVIIDELVVALDLDVSHLRIADVDCVNVELNTKCDMRWLCELDNVIRRFMFTTAHANLVNIQLVLDDVYWQCVYDMRASHELAYQIEMHASGGYAWKEAQEEAISYAKRNDMLHCTVDNFDTRQIFTNREYAIREANEQWSKIQGIITSECFEIMGDVVIDGRLKILSTLGANSTEIFWLDNMHCTFDMREYIAHCDSYDEVFPINFSPMNTYITWPRERSV